MELKVYCEGCNKTRIIKVQGLYKKQDIYAQGVCPYCGTFWCKKKGTISKYSEHDNEQWIEDYKYHIKDKDWKGVISDGKISSN